MMRAAEEGPKHESIQDWNKKRGRISMGFTENVILLLRLDLK